MPHTLKPIHLGPPPTEEQRDAARRACGDNATDMAELVTFLSMLGLEEGT